MIRRSKNTLYELYKGSTLVGLCRDYDFVVAFVNAHNYQLSLTDCLPHDMWSWTSLTL